MGLSSSQQYFGVISVQVSACWLLPCWCLQEWVYSRKCCTNNMENTPRRPSSTMWVFFILAVAFWKQSESSETQIFHFFGASQHCLPLPGFLLLSTDIYNHCVYFSQSSESIKSNLCCAWKDFSFFTYMEILSPSAPVSVPMLSISVPIMWLYMLGNIITQYPASQS